MYRQQRRFDPGINEAMTRMRDARQTYDRSRKPDSVVGAVGVGTGTAIGVGTTCAGTNCIAPAVGYSVSGLAGGVGLLALADLGYKYYRQTMAERDYEALRRTATTAPAHDIPLALPLSLTDWSEAQIASLPDQLPLGLPDQLPLGTVTNPLYPVQPAAAPGTVTNPLYPVQPAAAPGASGAAPRTGSGKGRRARGNPRAKMAMEMAKELRGRGYNKSEALKLAWQHI